MGQQVSPVVRMLNELKAAGKSDEWVAANLGVSWKTLYRWRRPRKDDGVRKPWAEHFEALKRLHARICAPPRKRRTVKKPLPPVVPTRIVVD